MGHGKSDMIMLSGHGKTQLDHDEWAMKTSVFESALDGEQ